MLFPNAKRINLKVSVHQFRTYGRDFRCLLAIKLLGKKARTLRESALELWCSDASCSERDSIFCISAFRVAALTICWYS